MNACPSKRLAKRSKQRPTSFSSDLRWEKIGQIGLGQTYIVEVGDNQCGCLLFSLSDVSTGEIYSLGGDEKRSSKGMDSKN
jgi:hypothetical protein